MSARSDGLSRRDIEETMRRRTLSRSEVVDLVTEIQHRLPARRIELSRDDQDDVHQIVIDNFPILPWRGENLDSMISSFTGRNSK